MKLLTQGVRQVIAKMQQSIITETFQIGMICSYSNFWEQGTEP